MGLIIDSLLPLFDLVLFDPVKLLNQSTSSSPDSLVARSSLDRQSAGLGDDTYVLKIFNSTLKNHKTSP